MTERLIDNWRDTCDKLRQDFATGQIVSYGDADTVSCETIGNRIVIPSPFRVGFEIILIPLGIEPEDDLPSWANTDVIT